ncbi:MAG: HAMP domain-containing histidine kinase [Streptosporangiaceae bacterium]|nr:HAMP domain-containing histidine kinase [Streptosporangiaceae bacterium]
MRTLRGRLIAGLALLLFAACAVVGAVTYIAVQRSLSSELDAQLLTASAAWSGCGAHVDGSDHDADNRGAPGGGDSMNCYGLGPGTFTAYIRDGRRDAGIVGRNCRLSRADWKALQRLPATPPPQPGSRPQRITTEDLQSAGGQYRLTAMRAPDKDFYVTGLSTSPMNDTLRDVALTELAVFGAVVVLAGVLGTGWVRLSLRPLRRVAATASAVAELPLESGEVELPCGVPDTDQGTETGQVGAAFNRMLGHVQAALGRREASEARLRRFAADASHELRTPLAAIRGYAELALRHPGPVPDAVAHALSRVQSESARMSVLVDDLLLLARLDAGRPLSSEPVDLSRMAIDAISDAQVARTDHRWQLELPDDPVEVLGDEHRLHQVLVNLLSNAGRHTPEGTTVTVKIAAGDPHDHAEAVGSVRRGALPPPPRAELSVTDDGPGIPPGLLPDLFERFTRADTSRSRAGDASSAGLGLAIVDAVVAAHKGAVTVSSHPGMTRFTIALTALGGAADADQGENSARPRPSRRTLHRSLPPRTQWRPGSVPGPPWRPGSVPGRWPPARRPLPYHHATAEPLATPLADHTGPASRCSTTPHDRGSPGAAHGPPFPRS